MHDHDKCRFVGGVLVRRDVKLQCDYLDRDHESVCKTNAKYSGIIANTVLKNTLYNKI